MRKASGGDQVDKREVIKGVRKALRDFRSRLSALVHTQATANYAKV